MLASVLWCLAALALPSYGLVAVGGTGQAKLYLGSAEDAQNNDALKEKGIEARIFKHDTNLFHNLIGNIQCKASPRMATRMTSMATRMATRMSTA